MKASILIARIVLVGVIMLGMVSSASAKSKGGGYRTGFTRWRATSGDFSTWTRKAGTTINADGSLGFDADTAQSGNDPYPPGGYNGRNYYNGGSYLVGEAWSPEIDTSFNFTEAIASWNASTPDGTWIEMQVRAQYETHWSKWYILGIWASGTQTVERHSVRSQGDTDGYVAVDTFVSTNKKEVTSKLQLRLLLFSAVAGAAPSVQNASLAFSTTAPKSATVSAGNPQLWGKDPLNVPLCSQMVYPDGGEVWCSPTSTSMVLGYWGSDPGACEQRVRAAVTGVFDWIYDGHGNWPFNTAYAATKGYEAYVARFTSLAKAEEFIAAGVPVVMSIAWGKGDLTGSTIPSTNGHLLVLVGFDSSGNPIINDPAASTDAGVRVTYQRAEFEPLWLESSGGTVYLIYPPGTVVPSLP